MNDKTFKAIASVSLIVVTLSVAYYFVVFLPKKEQMRIEQQKQEQEAKDLKEEQAKEEADTKRMEAEDNLNSCLDDADTNYSTNWDNECAGKGEKKDCGLPSYKSERLDKTFQTDKENCFKQYPQN